MGLSLNWIDWSIRQSIKVSFFSAKCNNDTGNVIWLTKNNFHAITSNFINSNKIVTITQILATFIHSQMKPFEITWDN